MRRNIFAYKKKICKALALDKDLKKIVVQEIYTKISLQKYLSILMLNKTLSVVIEILVNVA